MAEAARRLVTYADIEAAPPSHVAEILAGELYTQPRPALPHALTSSALGVKLGDPFGFGRGGPGGWWILDEPELQLGGDVIVPDLAGWRRERLPRLPIEQAAMTMAPDWVCEVLSLRTEVIDRGVKMELYRRERVEHVWLVQPLAQTIEAYRLDAQGWLRFGVFQGKANARIAPFDAIELELEALWAT